MIDRLRMPLVVAALAFAVPSVLRGGGDERPASDDPYVVVLTEEEDEPDDLALRYPELVGPWEAIARFNLLRPGRRIELTREMLQTDGLLAKVADHYGEVEIRRSFDSRFAPVVDNQLLREGDVVRTWRGSGARIRLEDGNYFLLRSHSRARVVSLGSREAPGGPRVRLELLEGSIWSRTQRRREGTFEVETATARTIIRGTDFRLKVEAGDATRLEVLEGVVEMRVGDDGVEVGDGQGLLSVRGRPPAAPRPLPAAPAALHAPRPKQVFRQTRFEQTFRWEPVAEATGYHLEVARDDAFFELVWDRRVGPEPATLVTDLEPGTYFWRVSAVEAAGFEGPPTEGTYFVFVQRRP